MGGWVGGWWMGGCGGGKSSLLLLSPGQRVIHHTRVFLETAVEILATGCEVERSMAGYRLNDLYDIPKRAVEESWGFDYVVVLTLSLLKKTC